MFRFFSFNIAAFCGLFALTACCPSVTKPLGNPEYPYPLAAEPKVGDIVHLPTGVLVTPAQMIDMAGDARVVYVGETHDNPASHRLELDLLKGLAARHPGKQALGMEMFARSQQPVLDRWVAGKLDEKAFLKESRWYDQWKMDFNYYRDLLIFARDNKIPVIALNAEKKEVTALAGKGPEDLTQKEKTRVDELDFSDPYQRAMVAAVFGGHGHGSMGLDGFVRAQTVWDETMAQSVADYLTSPAGKEGHILVVAGGNHVSYGFGIPRRVFRRLPASYVTVGGHEINVGADKQDRLMNVEYPEFPMMAYDFLAYFGYEDLPKTGMKLGVMIEPAADGRGLTVDGVVPGSNAEAAGLKKGDRILSFDGEATPDSFDLVYAVQHKHPGDHGVLEIERNGAVSKLDVLFKEMKEPVEKK